MTAGYIGIHGVTGAGLQAMGEWPAPTGDLQPLVDALLAAAEQTDDEERGRLRTMATWASDFSQDVAANVAAAAAIYGIGGLGRPTPSGDYLGRAVSRAPSPVGDDAERRI